MNDVFISYSRKDQDVARRVHQALLTAGRDVWVDWEGIPPSAEWLRQVYSAIDEANAFVFIISPDSMASEVCLKELNRAVMQGKRILPVVHRDVAAGGMLEDLRKLNWIFMREQDPFDERFQVLLKALDTDLPWVEAHTKLLVTAVAWDAKGRDRSYVLKGRGLQEAEAMRDGAAAKNPELNPLQLQFLASSRQTATAGLRRAVAVVSVLLMTAVAAGVTAFIQRGIATERSLVAVSRQLASRSDLLAVQDPVTAMLLAVQAFDFRDTLEARQSLFARSEFARDIDTTLHAPTNNVIDAVAMDARGARIAAGGTASTVLVWEARPPGIPREFEGHKGWIGGLVFSPDGKTLTSTATPSTGNSEVVFDETLIWNLATGGHTKAPPASVPQTVRSISPDGNLEVMVPGNDPEAGSPTLAGNGMQEAIQQDAQPMARIRLRSPKVEDRWSTLGINGKGPITSFAFSGDSQTLAARAAETVYLIDTRSRKVFDQVSLDKLPWLGAAWGGAPGSGGNVSFEPDGGLVVLGPGNGTVTVSHPYRPVRRAVRDGAFRVFDISPDGSFVVGTGAGRSASGVVKDVDTGELWLVLPPATRQDGRRATAFSADGTLFAFDSHGRDGVIRLWRPASPEDTSIFQSRSHAIDVLAVNADGTLLAAVERDGKDAARDAQHVVTLWKVGERSEIKLTGDSVRTRYASLAFSPDGRWLAAGGASGVLLRDLKDPSKTVVLKAASGQLLSSVLAFSPDSQVLAVGADQITVWDLKTRQVIATYAGKEQVQTAMLGSGGLAGIASLAFDPSGRILAASRHGGVGGDAVLWDRRSGEVMATVQGAGDMGGYMAFRKNGAELVYASVTQPMRVIDVDPKSLVAGLCRKAGRALGRSEWARFVGTFDYKPACSNTAPTAASDACAVRRFDEPRGCRPQGDGPSPQGQVLRVQGAGPV